MADIIDTIALLFLQKKLANNIASTTSIFGKTQSLMCFRNASGIVTVETPNKQVKEYSLFGINVPAHVKLLTFTKEVMQPEVV